MSKIINKQEFIIEYGKTNKYDYSLITTITSNEKMKIICIKHRITFNQSYRQHKKNVEGCPCCRQEKYTQEHITNKSNEFKIKAVPVHGTAYNYDLVKYTTGKEEIYIKCNTCKNIFEQYPTNHLSGAGCPTCKLSTIKSKISGNKEEFVDKALLVLKHKDDHNNHKYNYDKVIYINRNTNVIITCLICNTDFPQAPHAHLQGAGCSNCNGGVSYGLNGFIEKSLQHKNHKDKNGNHKYNYDKTIYVNSDTKLIITCLIHGDFEKIAYCHTIGHGCNKCNLCPSCGLFNTMGILCEFCEPRNENKLYKKTKEFAVVKYLRVELPNHDFVYNKSVGKAYTDGHLFPDILYEFDTYNIIIEVDEHKHRGATYQCEMRRMYDIIAKLGLPTIFIRYNPDDKNSDKKVLLQTLKDQLNYGKDTWDDYGFKVIYLFYN